VLRSEDAAELFEKYGVLNSRELRARVDILLEHYVKTLGIEARTLIAMLQQQVLPAALRFQTELAETIAATQAAGVECPDSVAQLEALVALVSDLRKAIADVQSAEGHHVADLEKHCKYIHETLVPAMERARALSDRLEAIIPDDLWTLPTYAEMLFMR
jgi:glutamine synthetase